MVNRFVLFSARKRSDRCSFSCSEQKICLNDIETAKIKKKKKKKKKTKKTDENKTNNNDVNVFVSPLISSRSFYTLLLEKETRRCIESAN